MIFDFPKRQVFILLCLISLALLFVKKSMIENETTAFYFLDGTPQGSWLQVRSILQYLSIPIIYVLKFTSWGMVLWMGCFVFSCRVTFAQCWGLVLVAEFVFIVAESIKIFWFLIIQTDPTIFEVSAYYPFSILQIFDYQNISKQYHYPLKALNLFEIVNWYILALGIKHFTKRNVNTANIVIFAFYVPIFLVWLLFYVFVYK